MAATRPRPISIPVHTLTHDDRALVHAHNAPPLSHTQPRGTSSSPVSVHSNSSPVSHPPISRSQSPEPLPDLVDGEDELTSKPVSTKPTSTAKPRSRATANVSSSTPTTTTTTTTTTTATTTQPAPTKPTSRKPSRSPSPPPPPQPPQLQTIRLEINLGGPDNYEVDISALAKATGQRPSTPLGKPSSSSKGVVDDDDSSGDESGGDVPKEGSSSSKDKEKDKEKDKDKDKGGKTNSGKEGTKDGKEGKEGTSKDGGEPDGNGEGGTKKKKKKKHAASEYYDTSDPFIDDSELAIDERTWFAQTKQQGFYVSSGEVALLKDNKGPGAGGGGVGGPGDKSKKPKSKKAPASSVSAKGKDGGGGTESAGVATGTRDEDKFDDDERGGDGSGSAGGTRDGEMEDTSEVGQKRKRYITVVDQAGKKRKVVDINSFHPDVQAEIEVLKEAISKESWGQKGKFPPTIKPFLGKLAILAIRLGEYDDHFFTLMPTLFPYNKFTMSKLIKRTVFQDHVQFLTERQEVLLKELAEQAKAGFSKAEEEWEKSVQAWDKRQEKARLEAAAAGGGGGGGEQGMADSTAPTRHPTEEMEVDGGDTSRDRDRDRDKEREDGAPLSTAAPPTSTGPAGKDPHPPGKKYRLTESMKAIVWELVMLSNECCRLENEKNALEGSVIQVSEQGSRKVLYQKIVAAFPEGWMSSGQISRDVSSMKKKFEKEAMENEA